MGDAGVVVRADSLDFYALNPSAFYAWKLLKSAKSVHEASAEYAAHYGVSEEVACNDIRSTWSGWQETLLAPLVRETPFIPPALRSRGCGGYVADYSFWGKVIRVSLDGDFLMDEVAPRLSPLLHAPVSQPDVTFDVIASQTGYHIYVNSRFVATEVDLSEARVRFLREFVRCAMSSPKWLATFHAAACGDSAQCVLFPAASHSGKTTLAAALMHAGFVLYTEDSAVLEAAALTVPMTPFSLMIREGSWPVLMSRFPELAEATVLSHAETNVRFLTPSWNGEAASAPVSAIIFSRYERACDTSIEPLDPFESLSRLQASGFWVEHDRESIGDFLQWLTSRPSYSLSYSELDDAIKIIRDVLESNYQTNPTRAFSTEA